MATEVLTQKELDDMLNEFNELSMKANQSGFAGGIRFMANDLPAFFQKISTAGFNKGYEKGKNEKVDHIIKQN